MSSNKGLDIAASAAFKALSSPLAIPVPIIAMPFLDLNGAQGVLVNLTGGPDMEIGEFETVGNTIRAFTSEDATIVVGTVIDPEMSDEIRVTVVVTGLVSETTTKNNTLTNSSTFKAKREDNTAS